MPYPTGIVKNEDGSFTLTAIFATDPDTGDNLVQTIPADTANPGAIMAAFFYADLAVALSGTTGYPQDNMISLLSGAMVGLT